MSPQKTVVPKLNQRLLPSALSTPPIRLLLTRLKFLNIWWGLAQTQWEIQNPRVTQTCRFPLTLPCWAQWLEIHVEWTNKPYFLGLLKIQHHRPFMIYASIASEDCQLQRNGGTRTAYRSRIRTKSNRLTEQKIAHVRSRGMRISINGGNITFVHSHSCHLTIRWDP